VSEPILIMKDIDKSFPGVKALDKAYIDVLPGEVHALLGENGAGKSTFVKILTGVYQPDGGKIIYKGKEITIPDPLSAQKLGISIIFQEFNLFPHLTVAQNIFINREPKTKTRILLDEKKINKMAKEQLGIIHLDIDPQRKVSSLSVAEQQMVEIVKAISFKSEILVMDEPTAALTEAEIEDLFAVIKQLKASGVGIIYISHRLEELKHIADRVTVMRDGHYIKTVNYRDTTIPELVKMMVGRPITEIYPKRTHKPGKVMLEVKNLNQGKRLKNISFNVREGEVLGVAGLVGAGRTEMARAIFGADPIDSGEIYLEGKKLKITSPHDAIEKGIGYLTEDRKRNGLALGLNVKDNIVLSSLEYFVTHLGFLNDKKITERSGELVELLRIKTPSLEQKTKFLSGGNQQKVIVAKWLCRNSKVLIFDEPTRGIDVGAKREIYELINKLTEEGVAVIMISSELPEIIGMSDRVLVMHEGTIAGEISREEATEEKILMLATGNK